MRRDLNLMKNILLKIEEDYINTTIYNLQIEGYTMQQIANHCEILYEEGLISKYKGCFADNELYQFAVGNLTNKGFNYLDTIRNTDNLEAYKNIPVYVDNSTNIHANKIKSKDSIFGGAKNNQTISKSTEFGIDLNLTSDK